MVVTGHVYPFDTVDKVNAERGTVDACKQAMELAYGLLWVVGCDRSTKNGQALYLARKAIYERLDKAGQARGITAARETLEQHPPLLAPEDEMRAAIRAWLTCPVEKRPSPQSLGERIAGIAQASSNDHADI